MPGEWREPKPDSKRTESSVEARVLRTEVGRKLFGGTAAEPTPVCLGPYHLRRAIGAGGMGVVFEAVDTRNEQRLAIKTLRKHRGVDALQQLQREFRALVLAPGVFDRLEPNIDRAASWHDGRHAA
jgi:serine/threonine protein kinase